MTPEELAARAKEKQQKQEAGAAIAIENIECFQASFSKLIDDIEVWLNPFFANGTASISRIKSDLNDSTANARYEIEHAEIAIAGQKITLTPEYLYGIGHSCSVACSGFKSKVSIFKGDIRSDEWLVSTKSVRDGVLLDESGFMKLIEPLVL